MRRIVLVFLVIMTALAGVVAWRLRLESRARHAPSGGSGELEGVELDLSSRLAARVVALEVREGDQVRAGDLLVRLDCAEPEAAVAEAEARLTAARAQAEAAESTIGAARGTRAAATRAGGAARAQAAALAAQRDAAARQADRLDALETDVPVANRDQGRTAAVGLGHQVEAAEAQALVSDAQARAAGANVRAAEGQAAAARATLGAVEAVVARAKLLAAECEVRAPRAARVSELPFEIGELTTPGAVLVRLVDAAELRATFYLPNAELAAAKTGARAVVVADAYPGETFEGRVSTVALEAEFTPRNIQTRSDRDRLVYPVEVVVPNADGRLRPGMPVEVSLPGTER